MSEHLKVGMWLGTENRIVSLRPIEDVGFVLKGITILYQSHKRLFPYGYPAAYVPNMHHQYIVILRNEGA